MKSIEISEEEAKKIEAAREALDDVDCKSTMLVDEEPETFGSDEKPGLMPRKIVPIKKGYEDPLGKVGKVFSVHNNAYVVKQVLNRMRRQVKYLGIIDSVDPQGGPIVVKAPDGFLDPLSEQSFVFCVDVMDDDKERDIKKYDLIGYRVNNPHSQTNRRTIKLIGKAIFDFEEGVAS